MKDKLYKDKDPEIGSFKFDTSVARIFDDMLVRSIPFYREVNRMSIELLKLHLTRVLASQAGNHFIGSREQQWLCYDLGSSTGTFLREFSSSLTTLAEFKHWRDRFQLIGIDNASSMNEQAQKHLETVPSEQIQPQFKTASITEFEFPSAAHLKTAGIIMQYTLQFIHPLKKAILLQKLYNTLMHGGFLLVSEKIAEESMSGETFFKTGYEAFKERQGYNRLEIARKRKALKSVLTPLTLGRLSRTLRTAGFTTTLLVFKWYNFTTLLALKR